MVFKSLSKDVAPILLLTCINNVSMRLLQLRRQSGSHGLQMEYEAPEIIMRFISPHWFNIQCTIPKSSSEFNVFVTCPALASPCYENCLPIKSCSENDSSESDCLPDGEAVNCTELMEESGKKVASLWIDKRDTRVHGSWFCTSHGVKSTIVNVSFLILECLQI